MENGWSMKHLHRLIVTSRTYRMSSSVAGLEKNQAVDIDNQHWWRREPNRIESQVVRDAILTLAGTLDSSMGGPSVPMDKQEQSTRRSLYFNHSGLQRNSFLTVFDEAVVEECYRRAQSIVPQQALALSNSGLVLDASAKIADQLSNTTENDLEFIERAFRLVLCNTPDSFEIKTSQEALAAWRAVPENTEESVRAQFVWALLNHNDFVTLR